MRPTLDFIVEETEAQGNLTICPKPRGGLFPKDSVVGGRHVSLAAWIVILFSLLQCVFSEFFSSLRVQFPW